MKSHDSCFIAVTVLLSCWLWSFSRFCPFRPMEKPWFVLYFSWLRGRERGRQREKKSWGRREKKSVTTGYSIVHPEESKSCSTLGSRCMSAPSGGSRGGVSTWVHVLIEVSTQAGRTSSQIIVVLVNSLRWFCIAFNPPRLQYVKGSAVLSMIFSSPEREISSASFWSGGWGRLGVQC